MRNPDAPAPVQLRVLVSGTLAERPWGATLAALGLSGHSGQLTLRAADGARFRIAFAGGAPLGASSPAPADTVARIALAERLISATQARRLARVEDVPRLAAATGLALEAQLQLGRRVIRQRIARTFEVEAGAYVVEDRIGIPVLPGTDVDIRAAIYAGLRQHASAARLAAAVRQVGSGRLVLRGSGERDLARFGFGADAAPVLAAVRTGTTLPELLARHPGLDPRLAEAVVCTLAACDALVPAEGLAPVVLPRVPTPRARSPQGRSRVVMAPSPRRHDGRTDDDVRALIAARAALLARDADHFTFLGVPRGAPVAAVRTAYIELARDLHPDRLAGRGIADPDRVAAAVFGRVVTAFTVLTDPTRRRDYLAALVERAPRE